jgi:hypothetical protein
MIYILGALLALIPVLVWLLPAVLAPPPLIPAGDPRAYVAGCVFSIGNLNVAMRVAIDNVEIANRTMHHRSRECIGSLVDPGTHVVSTSCYMADGSAKAWEENVGVSSRQILYLPSTGSYYCW